MNKRIILTIVMIFSLTGCGGGSSSSTTTGSSSSNDDNDYLNNYTDPNAPQEITMVVNELYTVYPGDRVIKTSSESLVKIYRNDDSNQTTVMLIDGNATLIQNP